MILAPLSRIWKFDLLEAVERVEIDDRAAGFEHAVVEDRRRPACSA